MDGLERSIARCIRNHELSIRYEQTDTPKFTSFWQNAKNRFFDQNWIFQNAPVLERRQLSEIAHVWSKILSHSIHSCTDRANSMKFRGIENSVYVNLVPPTTAGQHSAVHFSATAGPTSELYGSKWSQWTVDHFIRTKHLAKSVQFLAHCQNMKTTIFMPEKGHFWAFLIAFARNSAFFKNLCLNRSLWRWVSKSFFGLTYFRLLGDIWWGDLKNSTFYDLLEIRQTAYHWHRATLTIPNLISDSTYDHPVPR